MMNIVYTFDDAYTEVTLVSIASLLNNNDASKLNIIILDGGITINNKEKIKKYILDKGAKVSFIKMIDLKEKVNCELDSKGWSPICFVRLFYASILKDYNKILHIDCDTLIIDNIEELYMTDISDEYGAACFDCIPRTKREAGLHKETKYVSNGVLLLNLCKWRNDNVERLFINYMEENDMPHLDQDVISAVLSKKMVILDPKYNMMPVTFLYTSLCCELFDKNEPYYTKKQIDSAVANPVILHLTGNKHIGRPWNPPCFHPYYSKWLEYANNIGYNNINNNRGIGLWMKLTKFKFMRRLLFEYEKIKIYKKI